MDIKKIYGYAALKKTQDFFTKTWMILMTLGLFRVYTLSIGTQISQTQPALFVQNKTEKYMV